MKPALYLDKSRLEICALEKIITCLILFSDSVYINARYQGESEEINRKLWELADVNLIKAWRFPMESNNSQIGSWIRGKEITVLDNIDYKEAASLVRDSISTFQERVNLSREYLRLTELVQLTNELWAFCIAGYLGAYRILAEKARVNGMFDRITKVNYETRIVEKLLELNNVTGGLFYLNVDDITYLREKYGRQVGLMIDKATTKRPFELESDKNFEKAVDELVRYYREEVEQFMQLRRNRSPLKQTKNLLIDIAALFFPPIGLWSVVQRLNDWRERKKELPIQWFLIDVRERIRKQKSAHKPMLK